MRPGHSTSPILLVILAAALMMGYSPAAIAADTAATGTTPDWFFHDIVDIAFVKQHVSVPMAEDVMLIDARPKRGKFDKGHIPMAVNVPDSEFDEHVAKLPKNKAALLIFYCEGLDCKLSHKSAAKAEKLGYTNVKVFAEGFPRWMKEPGHYASVSAEWLKAQMDAKTDMLLIDARPKKTKYDKGHIPGAASIPDSAFDEMVGELPKDKGKLLVYYCEGFECKLSHKSAVKAMEKGYTNVVVYSAGYPEWKEKYGDSGAVASSAPSAPAAATRLKAGKEEGSIDIEQFNQRVSQAPESLFLVDVRDADEFAKGSIKTAVNIPVDQLKGRIKDLPTDKPVVFVCGTGARSGESFYMVQDLRPEMKNVYYVEAGMTFNKDGSYTIAKP